MSRIGHKTIIIPDQMSVALGENTIKVTGPKGELALDIPDRITLQKDNQQIVVKRRGNDKKARSLHGLIWKLVSNMLEGVSSGFSKKLEFKGVGFRAEVKDKILILNVGFSHPVEYTPSEGIEIEVQKNIITVSGIDRQKVGQVAAEIRQIKPVEPYKGKGIKYVNEIPRRKPGKAAKTAIGTK